MKNHMKSSHSRHLAVTLLITLILCLILLQANLVHASNDESLDRALIDSLAKKNYAAAENLLMRGANPEAILGSQLNENAVCTAIDDRSTRYLDLLIQYGASPNAYWDDVQHELHRTPLVCSVYLLNFEAFALLLERGADPSMDLYDKSRKNARKATTAFTVALSSTAYPMALSLLNHYPLNIAELNRLVFSLENSPYEEAHPWNKARNELIAWAQKRVPTLRPKPASPRTGSEPDCLFSFRDHEEGLKKGTICWDTEDK
jgi:hypothetical protein